MNSNTQDSIDFLDKYTNQDDEQAMICDKYQAIVSEQQRSKINELFNFIVYENSPKQIN